MVERGALLGGIRSEPSPLSDRGSALVLFWAVVRLPGLALVVYLLRSPIVTLIETRFDVLAMTRFVIDVLSTPVARVAWAAAFFGVVLFFVTVANRFRPVMAYLTVLCATGVVVALLSTSGVLSLRRGTLIWLILAVNLMPSRFLAFVKHFPRAWNTFMLAGVTVAELFFAREYWLWLRSRVSDEPRQPARVSQGVTAALPGLLLASLGFAVFIRSDSLLSLEQRIRLSRDVVVVERGQSFNWLELDPTGTHLYATGHTLPYLRRYLVADLTAPPLQSRASTGGAQGFAYDPGAGEIYAFNAFTHQLLVFDAATLDLRHAIDVPDLSPGDPWLAVDSDTGTVTVVSEADVQVGAPLIVLDRTTGRILGRAEWDAGNILKHPNKPWLYLSFFRRRNEVLLYNLETQLITHKAIADSQAERMVYWKQRNELLVTSPLGSRIMRFDADRLDPKGYFPTSFGARAIALDESRQLLLCGNLATGYIEIIELPGGTVLKRHYLGPWLRTIQLQAESGTAYVSSNGALYVLNYASPLRQPRMSSGVGASFVSSGIVSAPRTSPREPPG